MQVLPQTMRGFQRSHGGLPWTASMEPPTKYQPPLSAGPSSPVTDILKGTPPSQHGNLSHFSLCRSEYNRQYTGGGVVRPLNPFQRSPDALGSTLRLTTFGSAAGGSEAMALAYDPKLCITSPPRAQTTTAFLPPIRWGERKVPPPSPVAVLGAGCSYYDNTIRSAMR